MPSMTISSRLQAKEMAKREEAERRAKAAKEKTQRPNKRSATSAPHSSPSAAGGTKRQKMDTLKARPPARKVDPVPSRSSKVKQEGVGKRPLLGAKGAKGADRGEQKLGSGPRGKSREKGRKVTGGIEKEKGKGKGKAIQSPKRGSSEPRKDPRKTAVTPLKGRQGKGGNVRKATATKAKGSPRRSSGGAGRAGAVAHLASNFRKALVKGPTAKQRRLFKLSKSLLPLGIWHSSSEGETFDLAPEWKASLLKRYENPPAYRKLKANLYPDSSLRGLVPVDEIPLCHCRAEDGCDADCINRLLLMECAPGRCPTLRGGAKHCENNAIQTKAFPATEIFRTFEGRGWGLRLSDERGAAAGTLLHEYLGEVITMDECRKRLRKVGRKGVDGSSSDFYFASLDGNLVLDGGPMGSESRFANHSCSPNCLLQKWSVLGETRVVLVAARDISVGEELTYNYQADTLEGFVERQKCLCGEPQCSGFIGGELVAVKAEEWQRRASKVMGQAKPQLEVVRELFHEGQELGYEELTDGDEDQTDSGSTLTSRYHGREMECLSILCKEGDEWLAQLAEVMEGRTTAADDVTAAAATTAERAEKQSAVTTPAAVAGNIPSGDEPPRRTSSRANRGVRKYYDESDSDEDAGGSRKGGRKVKAKETPLLPPKVDLVALERVLERAPAGLHIPEAVKAKKTATRASQVARTVWMLLDAASKNGLGGINVPAERQEPQAPPFSPRQEQQQQLAEDALDSSENDGASDGAVTIYGGGPRRGRGGRGGRGGAGTAGRGGRGRCASETRGRQGSSSDSSGAVGLSDGGDDGEDLGDAREEAGGEDQAQLPENGEADRRGDDAMDVCDDGAAAPTPSGKSEGAAGSESGCGQRLPLAAETAEERGNMRHEAEQVPGDDAGTSTMDPVAHSAEGGSGKDTHDSETPAVAATATAATATAATTTGASSAAPATLTASLQAAAETRKKRSGQDGVVPMSTRRGGKRIPSSPASPAVLPAESKPAPPPPSLPSRAIKKGDGSLDLPPKPKMTQVHQAIRSCKGLAPIFVPGASELEKLVAPAEAWAREACSVLKIKVPGYPATADGKCKENAEDKDKDNAGDDRERSKWQKLGLDGSAMTALEEKLQDVAEFSLAREQREEEIEKERLLKEKEAAKERRERQARLDRLAKSLKRRSRSNGSGSAPPAAEHGNASEGRVAAAEDKTVDGTFEAPSGENVMAWEARRSPRIISLGCAGDATCPANSISTKGTSAAEEAGEGSNAEGSEAGAVGWTEEDEVELHCLCRLPADTARFRTLMTCDLCHSWFHPACVRLKELPESQLRRQAWAFVCPMCEHSRGGVSNFACPPSPGFYIGRRMNRPGLEELETLMKHAESLPVDSVDGQAYLSYIAEQVAGWRDRCHAVVKDVEAYIQNGNSISSSSGQPSSSSATAAAAAAAAAATESQPTVPSPAETSPSSGIPVEDALQGSQGTERRNGAVATGERKGADDRRSCTDAREENGRLTQSPRAGAAGVVLSSVGRDLGYEAALVERLGRLACEGVLVEVVDVHKEDMMLRRSLWILTASLCFPSAAACLRAGQEPGLAEMLSPEDQEILLSSGVSHDDAARLRPTFETLEASLTEGRTLGLSRNRSSQSKFKSRRSSAGGTTSGQDHTSGGGDGEKAYKEEHSHVDSDSGLSSPGPGLPLKTPSSTSSRPPLPDERPSSDPLGAGVRVYTRLFDIVGDIIQAVVKSEAKPFREARNFLPELKEATRWAAIEQSWGYCRALASELAWRRGNVERSSTAAGATAAVATGVATTFQEDATTAVAGVSGAAMTTAPTAVETDPVAGALAATPVAASGAISAAATDGAEDEGDGTDVYCICREGDDGGVMVECDVCSEWFHASCVGLTELPEDEIQQYQCLVCCEAHPEKHGHYKHRWTTNVAVEASVRRMTPRRTNKNITSSPKSQSQTSRQGEVTEETSRHRTLSARRSLSRSNNAANPAAGDGMAGPTASPLAGRRSETARQRGADDGETVLDSNGCPESTRELTGGVESSTRPADNAAPADLVRSVSSGQSCKRLRETPSGRGDLPGVKRKRAAAMVTAYVERHYGDLGIPWPPERPDSPEGGSEDCDWDSNEGPQRSEHGTGAPLHERGCDLPAEMSKRGGLGIEATAKHKGENAEEPSHLALGAPSLLAGTDLGGGQFSSGCSSSGSGSGSGLGQGGFNTPFAPGQGGRRHVYLHEHQQYPRPQQQQSQAHQRDHPQHLHQPSQHQPQLQRQTFQGQEHRGSVASWPQPPLSPVQGFQVFASQLNPRGLGAASGAKLPSSPPTIHPAALATPGAARVPWSPKASAISHLEVDGGEGTGRIGVNVAKSAALATHIGGPLATSTPPAATATLAWSSQEQGAGPVGHGLPPPPGHG